MILFRAPVHSKFTKLDTGIAYSNISDGAKALYILLLAMVPGKNYNDAYLAKVLGITDRSVRIRKKELKERNLIYLHQVSYRSYMLFVGSTQKKADLVYKEWESLE